ncbi:MULTISPECIES: CatB-related O-acetyltransferase [Pseudomonadaceae]|uniref:CatB-related O-acetyltransferase n=1 Tax=Pseudomonadaceae TaxID=135621 RepID=UPI0015E3DB38|nr:MULTISPECIES: CatB-related O-acetyltransferase [Pseudomonadaceae]MBA1276621.1 CatB-related O-acetyltransferase [Stutzerimonas stutzeri]MBC8649125.1 CatB-related O-acetyltransferase [Pseudomonas sp. MT4]QXY93083.1 CatB-related O-acetyltransferase [Pseudomonas sp. MTM4]
MIAHLKNQYWKRWIRQHGCKVADGVIALRKGSRLHIEVGVELGHVQMLFDELSVGTRTYMRSGGELQNVAFVGRFCSIGSNVVLGQERNTHPTNWISSHPFQYSGTALQYQARARPAHVGHDVWIGRDAMVMEGVEIGTGCIVAARSVVTKSLPPYSIAAGVPARVVAQRHPESIAQQLLESKWWDIPIVDLVQLPLNSPEAFLRVLGERHFVAKSEPPALRITREGCKVL